MPIDRANTGRSFPPTPPYEVEREKIREFADAIGEEHPAYRDPGAAKALGYPDVIAPPTFPIVLTYAANLPILEELGIALKDLLHGNQRFAYTRPIRAGDRLTCVVTIDNVRAIDGADIVTTRGEVSAVDGEHVLTTWCSLVIREAAGEWDSAGQHDTGSG
jgi:acyl dehydratase